MIGKDKTGVLVIESAQGTEVLSLPDKAVGEQLAQFDDIVAAGRLVIGKKTIIPTAVALYLSDRRAKIRMF
jgi:hypothetical protein